MQNCKGMFLRKCHDSVLVMVLLTVVRLLPRKEKMEPFTTWSKRMMLKIF